MTMRIDSIFYCCYFENNLLVSMTLCISLNTVDFSLILCLPFVLFVTKRGSIIFFFFLGRKCISKPVKCFLSQNGQRGSLLVFYVGYILDDKNTLCNGCNFNMMISFYSESSCNMDSVHFKSCD